MLSTRACLVIQMQVVILYKLKVVTEHAMLSETRAEPCCIHGQQSQARNEAVDLGESRKGKREGVVS